MEQITRSKVNRAKQNFPQHVILLRINNCHKFKWCMDCWIDEVMDNTFSLCMLYFTQTIQTLKKRKRPKQATSLAEWKRHKARQHVQLAILLSIFFTVLMAHKSH